MNTVTVCQTQTCKILSVNTNIILQNDPTLSNKMFSYEDTGGKTARRHIRDTKLHIVFY